MQSSLLDEVKRFVCSDIPKALAAFTYIESLSDYLYTNVIYTLEYFGLSTIEAENLYRELDELLKKYLRAESYDEVRARIEALRGVVKDCFKSLNIAEETRKRIRSLTEDELKILKIAALGIVKKAKRDTSSWSRRNFDSIDIANFVSAMLSKDVGYEYIERLFAKTLLAVKRHNIDYGHIYRIMSIIPENLEIIKELVVSVADEYPSYEYIYSRLRQAEPHQVTALLNPNREFYRAVHGLEVEDALKSLVIEKIVFKGVINPCIEDDIRKAAEELAQQRCYSLMSEIFVKILESLGYEIDLKYGKFMELGYLCRYIAAKPGSTVYIYIQPFTVEPPAIGDEGAVMIVEGVGAEIPKYLEKSKNSFTYSHLVNAL